MLIGLAVAMIPMSPSAANDDVLIFSDNARCWQDATGNFRVDAALAKYHKRQVTLNGPDGTTIQLSIDKLSKPDQAYLINKLRAARTSSIAKSPSEERLVALRKPRKSRRLPPTRLGTPQRLSNVDWYPSEDASRLAAAQNKPIMWFRVLGDLSGFM